MINIEEIKEKLIDKLRLSGWTSELKAFILSSDFDKIITDLITQVDDGKRFTPPLKNVFTAFEECKWENLKVIICGQDVYPQLGVASGIAFDCSITGKEQPSLKYINDAIQRTVINPEPRNTDLRYLANQGILMLNIGLTCQVDKPGTHYKIWEAFIAYLLDIIVNKKKDLIFILMGKKAEELEDFISEKHFILKTLHPASAVYNFKEEWDCKDIFNKTNKILKDLNKDEIRW